jgi:hypothetical protein
VAGERRGGGARRDLVAASLAGEGGDADAQVLGALRAALERHDALHLRSAGGGRGRRVWEGEEGRESEERCTSSLRVAWRPSEEIAERGSMDGGVQSIILTAYQGGCVAASFSPMVR